MYRFSIPVLLLALSTAGSGCEVLFTPFLPRAPYQYGTWTGTLSPVELVSNDGREVLAWEIEIEDGPETDDAFIRYAQTAFLVDADREPIDCQAIGGGAHITVQGTLRKDFVAPPRDSDPLPET